MALPRCAGVIFEHRMAFDSSKPRLDVGERLSDRAEGWRIIRRRQAPDDGRQALHSPPHHRCLGAYSEMACATPLSSS
jgi:hypothetical protein